MWTYTLPSDRSVEILNEAGYPLFTGAPGCARTLRVLADYRERRERLLAKRADVLPRHARSDNVRASLLQSGPVLTEAQARPLLAAYGIGGADYGRFTHSAEQAHAAAQELQGRVALKVQSPDLPHKTEAGAVMLDVALEAIKDAYAQVLANAKRHAPSARIEGVLVQPMLPPGREMLLGITRDERWGPMLMVGMGGVLVEALNDTALAPVPLDHDAARALIGKLKGAALLNAQRGKPAADIDALVDVMVRLSQFANDHAELIAEIDLNPVIVHDKGVSLADALIVTRAAAATRRAAE
jgi:acyl-CoA synthetase (NDP forming)